MHNPAKCWDTAVFTTYLESPAYINENDNNKVNTVNTVNIVNNTIVANARLGVVNVLSLG